ncbi:MAG: 4-(cytidine 5'-diphospho)-2-C-methyl-D-erythritol kinase [Bacillota bacterium]|nr:4-(cytidine 5'-diphospho)-2-C-methyl-D-erythritol kinase [Bacillota bacterium]
METDNQRIEIRAYAKINLCLDVQGVLENGYHQVAMVMQQILLCDDVLLRWVPDETADGVVISMGTNRPWLPTDRRNLAWQAAELMAQTYASGVCGILRIDIKKRIPVAAGLAGGSSNCAAVIHGLNRIWDLGLSVKELCEAGARLGSDVPFCVMGQAAADPVLNVAFVDDPLACHCAVATGRGTDLEPVPGLNSYLVLSKPPISVSTAEAYRGVDEEEIAGRPDIPEMVRGLRKKDSTLIQKNMVNVLENYTLKRYPVAMYTKNKMQKECNCDALLMSGSGPTVFGLCADREGAKAACRVMKEINRESFWTRTTV